MRLKRRTAKPKQPPQQQFTDAQIAERAYVLWQARQASSKAGTETDDWEAAKASLQVEHALPQGLRSLWSPAQSNEAQKTALELHKLQLEQWKVWISGFGVLATIFAGVGLYLTYQNTRQEQQLNSERLVTDRFAKAVEQLGNADVDVRIGGIYSLERIAKDSPKDHWTIMEVLTAFVRNKAPLPKDWKPDSKQALSHVTTDVQSALTVIGRREVKHDPQGEQLDLRLTNLRGAYLNSAYPRNANLEGAYLNGADLNGADLTSADFSFAYLNGANLIGANLRVADLFFANLEGGDLTNANLESANLSNANLRGANLYHSNLEGADLSAVDEITTTQIKAAKNWQKAHYSPAFRQQLGLPLEKPSP